MTDETAAPSGGNDIAVIEAPADTGADLSISQAARALASARHRKPEATESIAESAETATAEPELAQANPESPEEGTTEGDQEAEPAKPAIDPPKSWTKDLHEHWASLDPVLQERIVARDREDQAAIKRAFNEAADERNAVKAEREAAEKVRQQYEAKLPELMKQIHQQGPFSDIKSQDDADALAQNDPFRYLQWDAYQKRLAGVAAEAREVEVRQTQERQSQWMQHVQKENEIAAEYIPELADKTKGPALTQRAAERLNELGFKPEELNDLASGKQKLSIYDHRIQRLIFSDLKLSDIQKAPKAVAAKPVPPVQRPGTARPQSQAASDKTQALTRQLETSGSIKDAVALRALQSQRRAS